MMGICQLLRDTLLFVLNFAYSFKYDSTLVKKMLEKKRAAGKLAGSTAQIRARLRHELNVARQDGQPEEAIQRYAKLCLTAVFTILCCSAFA